MMQVAVLCVDHLHRYMADPGDEKLSCPECGCHYVRRDRQTPEVPVLASAEQIPVKVVPGRIRVDVNSWLTDRGLFNTMLDKHFPELTSKERETAAKNWFGE